MTNYKIIDPDLMNDDQYLEYYRKEFQMMVEDANKGYANRINDPSYLGAYMVKRITLDRRIIRKSSYNKGQVVVINQEGKLLNAMIDNVETSHEGTGEIYYRVRISNFEQRLIKESEVL